MSFSPDCGDVPDGPPPTTPAIDAVEQVSELLFAASADIIERQADGTVRYIGNRVHDVRGYITALITAAERRGAERALDKALGAVESLGHKGGISMATMHRACDAIREALPAPGEGVLAPLVSAKAVKGE